jgi:hypothetical protein
MGRSIEIAVRRTTSHIPPGTDLRHERLRNCSIPLQPQYALLDPLTASRSTNDPTPRESNPMVRIEDHPEVPTPSPECEGYHDDLAVLAVGALDRDEVHRLLDHLNACPHCTALREDYSKAARALRTLILTRRTSPDFTNRIMALIRKPGSGQLVPEAPGAGVRQGNAQSTGRSSPSRLGERGQGGHIDPCVEGAWSRYRDRAGPRESHCCRCWRFGRVPLIRTTLDDKVFSL